MAPAHVVKIKRVYDPPADTDGMRVLVDRVWPRGLTKQRAAVDVWLKEIAPTGALRKWFGHDPSRWKQFQARYDFDIEVVDVDRHPKLEERWGDKVPVLLDGDRELCHYYLDHEAVDARLARMK